MTRRSSAQTALLPVLGTWGCRRHMAWADRFYIIAQAMIDIAGAETIRWPGSAKNVLKNQDIFDHLKPDNDPNKPPGDPRSRCGRRPSRSGTVRGGITSRHHRRAEAIPNRATRVLEGGRRRTLRVAAHAGPHHRCHALSGGHDGRVPGAACITRVPPR